MKPGLQCFFFSKVDLRGKSKISETGGVLQQFMEMPVYAAS